MERGRGEGEDEEDEERKARKRSAFESVESGSESAPNRLGIGVGSTWQSKAATRVARRREEQEADSEDAE